MKINMTESLPVKMYPFVLGEKTLVSNYRSAQY